MTEPCLHHPALNNSVIFYYASDEDRAKYAKDWPKDKIPPKEKPPFNRDWRLPKGPF
jgi:hypothetical protein